MVRQRLWMDKVRRTTGRVMLREEGGQVDRVAKTIRRTFNVETLGCSCGLLTGAVGLGIASNAWGD